MGLKKERKKLEKLKREKLGLESATTVSSSKTTKKIKQMQKEMEEIEIAARINLIKQEIEDLERKNKEELEKIRNLNNEIINLEILSPTEGEVFKQGQTGQIIDIAWRVTGLLTLQKLQIDLIKNGYQFRTITSSVQADKMSFRWENFGTLPSGDDYKIRIMSTGKWTGIVRYRSFKIQ